MCFFPFWRFPWLAVTCWRSAQNDDANDLIVGGKVSVDRNGDNEINLVTDEGHSLTVTREPENLVLVVTLERSLFGMTMGLLGNWERHNGR